MVMMKIDRPEIKFPPRPMPMPLPLPTHPVDQATFDLLDGDGNGKLSGDEWKRAGWTADRQKAFDADGDGTITRSDFTQARRFERDLNHKYANGDGQLDRTEFLGRFFRKLGDNPLLAKLPGAKAAIGAGEKVADSLDAMIGLPGRPVLPLKDRFKAFDADGDGAVSKGEYLNGRRKETAFPRPPIFPGPIVKQPEWRDQLPVRKLAPAEASTEAAPQQD